uniref:MPN domain-containing protein n=1 Tax=Noctiluca scintillans TaxID=2966 RepID=A0A7S1F0H1_NOCSC
MSDPKTETVEEKPITPTKVEVTSVIVHPIVLLSVVDHYNRVAKDTNKRVVGCLLGEFENGTLHAMNCFALPFEEDQKDSTIYFVDKDYLEAMFAMFKKVNTKERVIGWYHTAGKIGPNDLSIHEVIRPFCTINQNLALMLVLDVKCMTMELPVTAYTSEMDVNDTPKRTFQYVTSTVGALEAEEVGVEHLLRDIRNASTSTLATKVAEKLSGLLSLHKKLNDIVSYLDKVMSGDYTPNHAISYRIQEILNLLPDLNNPQFVQALQLQTNDSMLATYLAALVRTILALHELINNKLQNMSQNSETDKKLEKIVDGEKTDETAKNKEEEEEESEKKK